MAACRALLSASVSGLSVSGMVTCEISYHDRLAFSLAFAYFTDGVVVCLSLLGWITVPSKRMSNLDSLICVGMASVKRIRGTFQNPRWRPNVIAHRVPSNLRLEGSNLFLVAPWSPYVSK